MWSVCFILYEHYENNWSYISWVCGLHEPLNFLTFPCYLCLTRYGHRNVILFMKISIWFQIFPQPWSLFPRLLRALKWKILRSFHDFSKFSMTAWNPVIRLILLALVTYLICDVVDYNGCLSSPIIHGCQTVIPLLSRRIPDFKLNRCVIQTYCLC